MTHETLPLHGAAILTLLTATLATGASAQSPAAPPPAVNTRPPEVISPEVLPDRHITFRLVAPQPATVALGGPDLPDIGPGLAMTKDDVGVWETTVGPGAYRYLFQVDGVSVVDPRSPTVSVSNGNVFSLLAVPGSDFMDTTNVPHGAVASVTYYSSSLSKFRRMHIYTPPGYTEGKDTYPVLYLLHGSGDSDDSWSSIGRAGFILDN